MARWTETDIPNLKGGTAVVTGANSGLGYETTRALAQHGAKVIMACRNTKKAEAAVASLRSVAPKAELEVLPLDLADLDSVRTFADTLKTRGARVDLLINNAGVMAVPLARTKEGFEMQIGSNHLGHFALTGLLIDLVGPLGRIVSVSSFMHTRSKGLDFDDLNWTKRPYKTWTAYADSKLANLLFTRELAKRAQAAGKTFVVAAAHPGYASTHLQYVAAEIKQSKLEERITRYSYLFAQSAAKGALPSLYAATAAHVGNDDYFGPDGFMEMWGHPKKAGRTAFARNDAAAAKLWAMSEQLTGVNYLGA
jgi:NAD(P)-dependent dehydrogenase (short-subunit alcohol dehydrogenase family)